MVYLIALDLVSIYHLFSGELSVSVQRYEQFLRMIYPALIGVLKSNGMNCSLVPSFLSLCDDGRCRYIYMYFTISAGQADVCL